MIILVVNDQERWTRRDDRFKGDWLAIQRVQF